MSRKCELTGVGVQFGNNVSHSQRKTRRRFEPNLRVIKYASELTGREYAFRVNARCIRTVDKVGGFDNFIIDAAKVCKLSCYAKAVRKEILKAKEGMSA